MIATGKPKIAIACGGTGGHLFPGIAVGRVMAEQGCDVCLLISEKEVDRQAAGTVSGMQIVTLPAVGLTKSRRLAFARGFAASFLRCLSLFRQFRPDIALAMGGFTSAPPLMAARLFGAATFLHESNSIPGKANRWLSGSVRECFIGLPSAAAKLRSRNITVTGTPVRPEFFAPDTNRCRAALDLDPVRPVVLIMGGSQGAEGINRLTSAALPSLSEEQRGWQWLHITGVGNAQSIRKAYEDSGVRAQVHEFMSRMDLALGAASVAVSRSGASSLAELAAAQLPSVLIPFPAAADNHQYFNARACSDVGAAHLLEQAGATPGLLIQAIDRLITNESERERMRRSLKKFQTPDAAKTIAEAMLRACGFGAFCGSKPPSSPSKAPDAASGPQGASFTVKAEAPSLCNMEVRA